MLDSLCTGEVPRQMPWDELEVLGLLFPGDMIEAKDKRTGQRWLGSVDVVAPEQGKLWIYAELGERMLINTNEHSISRPV